MLGYGRFIVSQKETMFYRENPFSESHIINSKERTIGAAIGLSRVFNSHEFDQILNKVNENKRSFFASQLIEAISHRITDAELLVTTQTIAIETMITKWGYRNKNLSLLLGKIYTNISSPQTVNLINNLSGNKISIVQAKTKNKSQTLASKIWDVYFQLNIFRSLRINKLIIKNIYRIIFIIKPNHRMKNKWK
jgi:hypothetical protein